MASQASDNLFSDCPSVKGGSNDTSAVAFIRADGARCVVEAGRSEDDLDDLPDWDTDRLREAAAVYAMDRMTSRLEGTVRVRTHLVMWRHRVSLKEKMSQRCQVAVYHLSFVNEIGELRFAIVLLWRKHPHWKWLPVKSSSSGEAGNNVSPIVVSESQFGSKDLTQILEANNWDDLCSVPSDALCIESEDVVRVETLFVLFGDVSSEMLPRKGHQSS
jgi:hypothetical protein